MLKCGLKRGVGVGLHPKHDRAPNPDLDELPHSVSVSTLVGVRHLARERDEQEACSLSRSVVAFGNN